MNDQSHDDYPAASARYFRRLELVKASGKRVSLPAPDADKLARHIKLYGTEGVDAIRDAYPLESLPLTAYRTTAPRGRRITEELIEVILHFRALGSPVSALATTLNLSERRIRAVLAAAKDQADTQRVEMAPADPMDKGLFVPVRPSEGHRPSIPGHARTPITKPGRGPTRSRREGAQHAS